MNKFFDLMIPRFMTEEVALSDNGDHYEIACSMVDVQPGETFDAIGTMRIFNLFGFALFPSMVGDPRPFTRK